MVSVQCTECLAIFQIGTRLDRHTSNSRLSRDLCLFSTGLKFEPSEAPLLCTSSRIDPKGSRVRLVAGNLSASIGQNHFIQNNLQAKSSSNLTPSPLLAQAAHYYPFPFVEIYSDYFWDFQQLPRRFLCRRKTTSESLKLARKWFLVQCPFIQVNVI